MPNVRASSATIGTIARPERRVAQQLAQHAHERHRGRHLFAVGLRARSWRSARAGGTASAGARGAAPASRRRGPRGARADSASRHCPPRGRKKRSAATSSSLSGSAKRSRNSRSASTSSFFCWCARHARLACAAHPVAFFGLGEDRPWAGPCARARRVTRRTACENRARRAASASISSSLMWATSARSSGSRPKKCARLYAPSLAPSVWYSPSTVAARCRSSALAASRANRASQSDAPQDLDHVPARAEEQRFELLDDLAVAAHRPVEALQVAVDDRRSGCRASRARRASAPAIDSGSSISPSPKMPQTCRPAVGARPRCSR